MITICLTYFRSLTLANLRAALYSVRWQDLSRVERIVVVDNNTEDSTREIERVVDELEWPVSVKLLTCKHEDPNRTHSWSTNLAVSRVKTPWVLFTRADYLLDSDIVARFAAVVDQEPSRESFITARGFHLEAGIDVVELTDWRRAGVGELYVLPGALIDYTQIDSGVWMARKATFDRVEGLDESLTAWGHAQTHFQHKVFEAGVEFVQVPEVLFYHPRHSAMRDLGLAHQQLRDHGIDIKQLWKRYEGVQPY